MEDLEIKLKKYVDNIKNSNLINNYLEVSFPSGKELKSGNKASLRVLVEQAEKLLNSKDDFCVFNKKFGMKDRQGLLELFVSDVEQYATKENLGIVNILSYSQSRISDHAFFHLSASAILPKMYETISLNRHENTFNIYSIPFKLRVAIENKLKSIIGFVSCDITRYGKERNGTNEFPVTMIINELIKLKCLNLPCSLQDMSNIYTWSCSFCHTGEKEYIWMSMKALEILSGMFLCDSQKTYELAVSELWHKHVLSEEFLIEKLRKYKGFTCPLYYLKKGWSISRLQDSLNKVTNTNMRPYKFNLSEVALDERSGFYCSSMKMWV